MKHYELLYLVSAQTPENELENITTEVGGWFRTAGAAVTKQESWGRRKLAYPIRHEKYGYYGLLEFDAPSDALAKLNKQFNLQRQILRHLIVDKKPISAKELLLQEDARRRAQTRLAREEAAKQTHPTDRGKGTDAGAKKDSKISLDDLDKKLDELLDTDMIR